MYFSEDEALSFKSKNAVTHVASLFSLVRFVTATESESNVRRDVKIITK